MLTNLLNDLKYSVRMLLKNPLFSGIAVLTLALGIGMNAATFSAVHALLLRPLSGAAKPGELVQLYRIWPGIDYGSNSIPHYQDVRDRTDDVFENTAAWFFSPMSLSADGRSERVLGMLVSANFFQTYGVTPILGRAFLPGVEDRSPGAHAITVLGYSVWQSRFGGDADVVGRTVTINGRPFEVVGVGATRVPRADAGGGRSLLCAVDDATGDPSRFQPHRITRQQHDDCGRTVAGRNIDSPGTAADGFLARGAEGRAPRFV